MMSNFCVTFNRQTTRVHDCGVSGVPCWRRSGVNAKWSSFCGQRLFPTTPEYQSRSLLLLTPVQPPGNNCPKASLQTRYFKHKLKTCLFAQCYNSEDWLFLLFTNLSFIDNVMHLCPWPHCNRRTENSMITTTTTFLYVPRYWYGLLQSWTRVASILRSGRIG